MDDRVLDGQRMFTTIIHKLLAGQIICEQSDESAFRYLTNVTSLEEVEDYVRRIGYTLRRSRDGRAITLCYADPNDPIAKSSIRQSFKETVHHLEPLVRWIGLVTVCREDKFPLVPGDNLYKSKLLTGIENAPSRRDELSRIARSSFIGSTSLKVDGQLSAVLSKLVQKNYLIEIDRQGIQFRATGKWSLLYDIIEFIELNSPDEETIESEQLRLS
ncbi:MAG: hypothetical protein V4732_02625 [Pseudomonadota bacterium]